MNDTGRRQAEAVGTALRTNGIAAIYASPLKRAWETGSIIAGCCGKTLLADSNLIDIDFGKFQGLTGAEASAIDPELMDHWIRQPQTVSFPGGESLAIVEKRVSTAIDAAVRDHTDETIVMVSHSVVCKVMVCHITGLDLSHFWQIDQATGGISVFERRNNMLSAVKINDTCHLKSVRPGSRFN